MMHSFIREIILCFILMISSSCFGQTNILILKGKEGYTVTSNYLSDSVLKLNHKICFDLKNWSDEEYCHNFFSVINYSLKKSIGKSIELTKKNKLIQCFYNRQSAWGNQTAKKIKRNIRIISWTDNQIEVVLNIKIYLKKGYIYTYIGKETFTPA
jgi:hypothetical protein